MGFHRLPLSVLSSIYLSFGFSFCSFSGIKAIFVLVFPVSSRNSDVKGDPEAAADRSMPTDGPPVPVAKLRLKRQVQSSFMSGSELEWVTWNNSLPNDAVSIYNDKFDRNDYVCKYKCEAGFYTPSMGSYCQYLNESSGSPFEILVNKNNFEILEWKEGSSGSVPQNSVRTCSKGNIYVGKNKYGLGKVATKEKHFYLPWKGSVYSYSSYQVLTTNNDIINQQVYDVRYITDESQIFPYPPETVRKTSVSNYECRLLVKTDSLSKTYRVRHKWDISVSLKVGIEMTFTVGVPFIVSESFKFSSEMTFKYSMGNMVTEAMTSTASVKITAPPNSSCMVKMVEYKYKLDIPFTASLRRTYANGEIRTRSVTGTYESIQVAEVRAVADRCERLEDSKPCLEI
uniref:Natterin-4 n=2 Tax=Cyclopterus lumpus TaxID=8103 RepID=A0A8C2XAA8_CYCLU